MRTVGFGIGRLCGVVNGERGLIEIALELKPGRLDKLLVIRIVGHRGQVARKVGATHPSQIYVREAICAGKQARRLRWGMFTQHDGRGNRRCNQQDGHNDGEAASYSHRLLCREPVVRS